MTDTQKIKCIGSTFAQTDKAVRFKFNFYEDESGDEFPVHPPVTTWVPKSQINLVSDTEIHVPTWLLNKIGVL